MRWSYTKKIFFLMFMMCRPILFTLGMWRALSLWVTRPDVFAPRQGGRTDLYVYAIVHATYFLGLLLQYMWFYGLLRQALPIVGQTDGKEEGVEKGGRGGPKKMQGVSTTPRTRKKALSRPF